VALANLFLVHCGNAEISRTDNYREVVVFFQTIGTIGTVRG